MIDPADGNEGSGVSVFLMELAAQPPLRGEQRTPLQLALRYLVTAWAGEPAAEHAPLGRLVMAAMEEEDLEVRLAPVAHATWASFGAAPRVATTYTAPGVYVEEVAGGTHPIVPLVHVAACSAPRGPTAPPA